LKINLLKLLMHQY